MTFQSQQTFKKFFTVHNILILFVLLCAIVLRFYKLGEIPVALNRDEASLGYTAYSILHTGMDEHGVKSPINIQSFGDWKLPLYVYTLVPVISLFGLSEFSVRLPSAIAGVLIVYFGYVLARLLVEREKQTFFVRIFPLLVLTSLAFSPWAVHVSRVAYEANLSLFYFLIGTVLFLMATQRELSKEAWMKKWLVWFYPLSAICFGLTLIGYHAFQVFTPLMALLFIAIFRKDVMSLWVKHRVVFITSVIIFTIFLGLLLFANTSKANSTKYGGLTIFSEKLYHEEMFEQRQIIGEVHPLLAKLYANDISFRLEKILTNILRVYNSDFLFLKGGNNGAHNIVGVGNLYLIELLPILIGGYFFIRERKQWQQLMIGWILCATIAPILTIEANHSIRFLPALAGLHVMMSYGVLKTMQVIAGKKGYQQLLIGGMFGIYLVVLSYLIFRFVITYFIIFPTRDVDRWQWYSKEIVTKAQPYTQNNQFIYMQGESSSPYIYFLFYLKDQYQIFENDLEFYPPTDEGFVHAKRLGNIYFQDTNWFEQLKSTTPATFILEKKEIPDEIWSDKRFVVRDKITHPHSQLEWNIIEYTSILPIL